MITWHPIAEAPRDGTRVLLMDGKKIVFAQWEREARHGYYWWDHTGRCCTDSDWTHWAPINLPGGE